MYDLLTQQLGPESQQKMQELRPQGYLVTEAMEVLVNVGMESQFNLNDKFIDVIEYLLVKEKLQDAAQKTMTDLLEQGCNIYDVVRLFKKYGDNLEALSNDVIFTRNILVLTLQNSLFFIKRIKLGPSL